MAPSVNDTVSVIIPIYNASKFLDQCLESIEQQTHKQLEIICINDGSTDNSLDIIKAHAAKDDRYVVVDKENAGYGAGCNKGISVATGQWISIVEPDDYLDLKMYGDMLAFAAGFNTTIDIVKTPWTEVADWDVPEATTTHLCPLQGRLKNSKKPFTLSEHSILIELHPSIWSAIYRADFIRQKNITFPEYPGAGWADNPFLIETMCQAKAIVYLDTPYYCYRADLINSTVNHTTEAAVARPFDRWCDMMDIIEKLGITDLNIIRSHYIRGFNYAFGAIHDDGIDNPIVKAKTKQMFSRMKPEIVFSIDILPERRRRYYCRVMEIPEPKISRLPWFAHLVKEGAFVMKRDGYSMVRGRALRAFDMENKELKGDRTILDRKVFVNGEWVTVEDPKNKN